MADVKYKEILSIQTAREEEEKEEEEEEEEEDSPSDQSVAGRRRVGAGDTTTTTLLEEEEEKEEGGPMLGNWRYKKDPSPPVPRTVFFEGSYQFCFLTAIEKNWTKQNSDEARRKQNKSILRLFLDRLI